MTRFLLAFAMIFFGSQAFAGILIEPYAGYHIGKTKGGTDPSTNLKGLVYGGRLGYQTMGFQIGADYLTGSISDDASPSSDYTPTDLGAFVGYQFPVLIRVYAAYGFAPQTSVKTNGTTLKYHDGTSYKLGIGYTGLPFVNINFEYYNSYSKKADAGEFGTLDLGYKAYIESYGLMLSVPFDL
jgi:hypothetical protein